MRDIHNKTSHILIRVSPTEKKNIEEKARLTNKSVARYLIELSENRKVVDTKKLPPLILEIRRIGVNINQIAAVANTQKYVNRDMLENVDSDLKEVVGILEEILSEVYDVEEHSIRTLEHKTNKLISKSERLEDKIDRLIKELENGSS